MAPIVSIDEQKLVEKLRNPSEATAAFDLLVRTYGESIYWQIRKIVLRHDDADDVLQNSLLKAWNNLPNFRGEAKLSTWLHKIAIHESINFVNREKSRRAQMGEEDTAHIMESLEADEYFDGDELHAALQAAVASLPEKQRLVFNMRYFDEMKYEEISEILGTSVGSLKASYHHAAKKVAAFLENKDFQ